ncbi:MAG TPA: ABC transporter permease [Candidatus Avanaerovorax faecigallinarum]|nr:ABC transporter permease [Candidatus Avanaerovorax faecigallinarum]
MKKFLKGLYIAVILLFLYLPIGVLMVLSFNESKSMSIWTGFSTRWYEEMFSNEMILDAVWNTFTIAICAAALSTVIGVLACLGISRMRSRSQKVIMAFNNIPLLNADIVTGISLMMTFLVFGISLSWGTVLLSHITFCIPYVILSVMPKIKQLSPNMYEAALDLGATPAYAFRKVILPDLMPGITSGFLLAFTMSVDDFVVTHFTRGAGINTISTLIYSQVKVGIRPTLFALSTVIFVIVLVVLVISNVVQNRKGARN